MVIQGKQIDNKKIIIGVAVAAAAGVAIWLIVRAMRKRAANTVFGSTEHFDAVDRLTQLNDVSTQVQTQATITAAQAKSLADQIKNAWGVANDDEDAIYNALQQLNNYSDWILLQREYGVNSSFFNSRDLVGDLVSRLNEKELQIVNSILNSHGIMDKLG